MRLGPPGLAVVWAVFAVAIPLVRTLHYHYTMGGPEGNDPPLALSIAKGAGFGIAAGIVLLHLTQLKM